MFVWAYLAATALIAWRKRSRAAIVALPVLVATMGLFWAGVPDAGAYSSALWALSGAYLLINSEYAAGTLYGISGIVYVLFYLGASNVTLSPVHIISDLAFIAGLFAGTWPNALTNIRRGDRRVIRGPAVQIAREDLARSSMRGGLEG